MVIMAYLTGLATTPAAILGVLAGLRWWAALRRSEGLTEGPLQVLPLAPPPPPPQDAPRINKISLASRPANRRPPRTG